MRPSPPARPAATRPVSNWLAMSWAIEATVGDRIAKFVLIRLCFEIRGKRRDTIVWPGYDLVAEDLVMSVKSVERAIAFLKKKRLIRLVTPAHQHYPARWEIDVALIRMLKRPRRRVAYRRPNDQLTADRLGARREAESRR